MEKSMNQLSNGCNEMEREDSLQANTKAVIFDFDGLLVDTETCMYEAWEALLSSYQVSVSQLQVAGLVGCSAPATDLYNLYRHASGLSISNEEIVEQVLRIAYQRIETITEREGVLDYLQQARKLGFNIALATSSEQSHYLPILERLQLTHFFDHFVGAEDIVKERRKPQPDVYLQALSLLGVSASQAIAFEDSPPGVTAARAAGIRTVAVSNTLTRHLDLSEADVVLSSMTDMPLIPLIHHLSEKSS